MLRFVLINSGVFLFGFFTVDVDVDVDNVQRREFVRFDGVYRYI